MPVGRNLSFSVESCHNEEEDGHTLGQSACDCPAARCFQNGTLLPYSIRITFFFINVLYKVIKVQKFGVTRIELEQPQLFHLEL